MTNAGLVVDVASIAPGTIGPTTGTIVVRIGDVLFPTPDWNDFVVAILDAWVTALQRLATQQTETADVYLMDGPYSVEIARVSNGQFRLRALESFKLERACVEVPRVALVEDAIRVGEVVLTFCQRAGYCSRDLDSLESSLRALRTHAGARNSG